MCEGSDAPPSHPDQEEKSPRAVQWEIYKGSRWEYPLLSGKTVGVR